MESRRGVRAFAVRAAGARRRTPDRDGTQPVAGRAILSPSSPNRSLAFSPSPPPIRTMGFSPSLPQPVPWASALVVTHKMGCLRCISAVATREILDFRLAKRKRPYPPVVVNKCCGCKFKDEFGNSHPRIQEDLQDLIAGHGG